MTNSRTPDPRQLERIIRSVHNEESFIQKLLIDGLSWDITEDAVDLGAIAYDWTPQDFQIEGLEEHLADGVIKQIVLPGNPWGVFILEFANDDIFASGRGMTGPLRKLLRALVPKRRGGDPDRPVFNRENLLFICNCDYKHYRFAHFKAPLDTGKAAPLAAFGWGPDDPLRTVCEFNLPELRWPDSPPANDEEWAKCWGAAFDVEKVTKKFYTEYAATFKSFERYFDDCAVFSSPPPLGEGQGGGVRGLEGEDRRLWCQTLFNRLMFLRFIERKGWLSFPPTQKGTNYLAALYGAGGQDGESFYKGRLRPLFFRGLALEGKQQSPAYGSVPFLNGGLFEETDLDRKVIDIPDDAFQAILGYEHGGVAGTSGGLFYRFNFTVEESTPLDIEVAVDPEMLGKVFEELVTGRHESGSYYTPRPVVSFMCREALKGFLQEKTDAPEAALAELVDHHSIGVSPLPLGEGKGEGSGSDSGGTVSPPPLGEGQGGGSGGTSGGAGSPLPLGEGQGEGSGGLTDSHARQILAALDSLKAVDPACGSGAYLLGLLHELVAIYRCLYSEKLTRDSRSLFDLKLRIISHTLYGVDIDPFATNIAMLRLWLSLSVEADDTPAPPALPNLDFKIETGDSLLGPNPQDMPDLFRQSLQMRADMLEVLKDQFLNEHTPNKAELKQKIEQEEAMIAEELHSETSGGIIEWRIQFADVFGKNRGFDIVLANPPYVRQELIKHLKPKLKDIYGSRIFCGTADLYTYFYARGVQLLNAGGVLAYISSNKFFRAAYGKKLRAYLAKETAIRSVTDFGDSPVFESATAYPMIFIAQKGITRCPTIHTDTRVPDGNIDVRAIVKERGRALDESALAGEDWSFADRETAARIAKMKEAGPTLKEYVNDGIFYGIKTGFNQAFVIDGQTRADLIHEDPKSEELIKPFLRGRDIKRWTYTYSDRWLIFSRMGTTIEDYPAIENYLMSFKIQLEPKPGNWTNNRPWPGRKSGYYKWHEIQDNIAYFAEFEKPKIIFPDISPKVRFAFDTSGHYLGDTTFIIPSDELFLIGILNSSAVNEYYADISAQVRGGYMRFKYQYVKQIPIPHANKQDREAIEQLVNQCLAAEGENCEEHETEINHRVAKLYGLE